MTKKQLTVAWIMGIVIIFIILNAPKYYLHPTSTGNYFKQDTPPSPRSYPNTDWNFIMSGSLIVLIIGGLLIYTLRSKKK